MVNRPGRWDEEAWERMAGKEGMRLLCGVSISDKTGGACMARRTKEVLVVLSAVKQLSVCLANSVRLASGCARPS